MELRNFTFMTFPFKVDKALSMASDRKILEMLAEKGFSCIDVMNVSLRGAQKIAAEAKNAGITTHCYIAMLNFARPKAPFIRSLGGALQCAEALGAELLMIVPQGWGKRIEGGWKARLVEYFNVAAALCKTRGISACFETTAHAESGMCSAEDCLYILHRVSDLGLVFDTANMLPCGEEPIAYYNAVKEYVIHTHLKDVRLANRGKITDITRGFEYADDGRRMLCCAYGEGVIPIEQIKNLMLADGYSGKFALEYSRPNGLWCSASSHKKQIDKFKKYISEI